MKFTERCTSGRIRSGKPIPTTPAPPTRHPKPRHILWAFHHTYGLPVKISNCSNNYGPCQYPEKLIPVIINNIVNRKPLPVYGKGENVRDWLYVEDHVRAIDLVFHRGRVGETYNIGGRNEWQNIELVRLLIEITDRLLGRPPGDSLPLITCYRPPRPRSALWPLTPPRSKPNSAGSSR